MKRGIKYYLLLLIACSALAADEPSIVSIDTQWQEGEIVAHGEDLQYKVYRKFIKKTAEGYLVQEFYSNHQRATNPFLLTNETDVTRYPKHYHTEDSNKRLSIQGAYERWYITGQQECRGQFDRDGQRTGLWTSFYRNGQKRVEGHFLQGKLDGIWTNWDKEGKKSFDSYFNSGKPEINLSTNYIHREGAKKRELGKGVIWREFYNNGQMMSLGLFKQGKREGRWSYWDENGRKEASGYYKDGKRNGTWTTFWIGQNNKNKEEQKKTEGEYLEGRKIGTWVSWDEKGNKAEEFYGDNSNDRS